MEDVELPSKREYPDLPVVGVGGVVVRDGCALLIRRGHPPLKGEWSIPGGTLEVGETIAEGIQRELLEETGIVVRLLDFIEVFDRIFRDREGRIQYHFVILDYLCEAVSGELRAGGDVTDAVWAQEGELAKFSLTPAATRVIRKAFALSRAAAPAVPPLT